jgi:hypothetical protein
MLAQRWRSFAASNQLIFIDLDGNGLESASSSTDFSR